jgi:hypothetical protein
MHIRRAVNEFMSQGNGLFQQLRSNGEVLSDVDLVALREQLHILDTQADHLQNLKQSRPERAPFIANRKRQADTSQQRSRSH